MSQSPKKAYTPYRINKNFIKNAILLLRGWTQFPI